MRMNYASVMTLMFYLCQIIASNDVNDNQTTNNEDALEQETEGLPVIAAEPVFEEIAQMIESSDETTKKMAKNRLQDLMTQMRDKTKQFAKLTIHGIKFAVNLGAENTALRAQNEAIATKLWNIITYILNGILSFFGLSKKEVNIKTREEIFSVAAMRNLEPFTTNDNEFIIHALKHTIAELEEVIEGKSDLMEHLQDTEHEITKNVIDDVKNRISQDEAYKKELETYLQEKEDAAKKYTYRN